ncbi:uncharacterized protein LOC131236579 [Magnolia sinica]|uniref:uncharacterized protein LOC131236579 n=1 Tax=Magnolia sinica TaxID=86752 RepID=UPI00265AA786|nr:uncharacterized protein LOC131236579 [Magnolia sinica]
MSSYGRFGGDSGSSFPDVGVEAGRCNGCESGGALGSHGGAPVSRLCVGEPCLLLIDGSGGADGFGSNVDCENDVGPSVVEGNRCGVFCVGIDAENGLADSFQCNGCENVSEISCPATSSNGDAGDGPVGLGLSAACEHDGEPLVIGRNGTGDGFGIGNRLCSNQIKVENRMCDLVQRNGFENILLINSNNETKDGLNEVHLGAASDDDVEPSIGRSNTQDGCGVSSLCSNESDVENRLHTSLQHNDCGHVLETACPLTDGIGENGQDGLHFNVASVDDAEPSVVRRNGLEDRCVVGRLHFNENDMENRLCSLVQCNGCVDVLETGCPLISDNGEDRQDGLCSNAASLSNAEPSVVGRNGVQDGRGVSGVFRNESDTNNCLCSPVQCDGCEDVSAMACPLINSGGDSVDGRSGLHFNLASKSDGKSSTTGRNRTGKGHGFSVLCSHEIDMDNRLCNLHQWDRCENVLVTACPLINRNGDSEDVPDVFCCNVSSENDAEPLSIVNEADDAYGASELCSNQSNLEYRLCTSLQGNGRGNILETSCPLIDSNRDAVDGLNEIGFTVSENESEQSITVMNGMEVRRRFSRLHSNESNTDKEMCRSPQCNRCEDVPEMTGSLNSNVDTLDGPPAGPHVKVAADNDAEPLIIGKGGAEAGCGVSMVCSNGSNIVNRLCSLGSTQEGPYAEKVGPANNILEGSPCNQEMCLSSLVQQNKQKGTYVFVPLEETVTGFKGVEQERPHGEPFHKKERPHGEASMSTGLTTQTSCTEKNPCDLEGSPYVVSHRAMEETHSKCLPVLDHAERDAGSIVDSSGHADNEAKVGAKLDRVSRNTGGSKLNRLSRTRKAARQCQQTADTIGVFLNNARRKRSYSSKRAPSSVWGAMGNIVQLFKQNDEILKFDSQLTKIHNRGSKKGRGVSGRRKRQKTRNSRSSRVSQAKGHSSTNWVCIKVEVAEEGGQGSLEAMHPEVVDSSASVQTVNGCSPESDCCVGSETLKTASEAECKMEGDGCGAQQFPCIDQNLKKLEAPDISTRDAQLGDKDMESTLTQETSIENASGDYPGVSSRVGIETSIQAVENVHSDPGTSPVMDMLHGTPVVGINTSEGAVYTRRKALSDGRRKARNGFIVESRVQEALHDAVLNTPETSVAPVDAKASNRKHTSKKKGKANGKVKGGQNQLAECFSVEEKLLAPANLNKAMKSTKRRPTRKVADNFDPMDNFNTTTSGNASSKASGSGVFIMKSLVSDAAEVESCQGTMKIESGMGINASSGKDVRISQSEPCMSEGLLSAGKIKDRKLPKRSIVGSSKHKSRATDSAKRGRGNASGGKKGSKSKDRDIGLSGQVVYAEERHALGAVAVTGEIHVEGNDIFWDLGRNNNSSTVASEGIFSSAMLPTGDDHALKKPSDGLEVQCLQPRVAWVRCDDCFKWRCISAALADEIEETNRKWTCKDNTDKGFADCLIPQEKSNAEINAELEISDASCEEDSCSARPSSKGFERRQLAASQQASWMLIKHNLFLHRSCKTQTIDEVMVCHCKPPLDGSLGCRDECLNRMLNIECVQGTCPCGDLCSNQQFQKRKYARFKWFRCGKKGYGLQLQENVSQGKFLIEYVGEVLDLHSYEARQRDYAARGQKHFYFMTLNGSEVIDACAKGNLGRFINHSCDPNCRTEKWMVNGEVCIGLFAIRDIKKGEEVTFDYNYVRVFGAAAKKCVCGSSECRGYIGGDPQNTEVIVQGDSDDEYPEPVMVHEDGESDHIIDEIIPNTSSLDVEEVGMIDAMSKSSPTVQFLEDSSQIQDNMSKSSTNAQQLEALEMEDTIRKSSPVQQFGDSLQEGDSTSKSSPAALQSEISFESEDTMSKSFSAVQPFEISSVTANAASKSLPSSIGDKSKSAAGTVEEKPDPKCPIIKSSRSSHTIKKGKCSAHQVIPNKPKRLVVGTGRGHFEGVEQKLNELLDADGGISKRKDSTKGYLKLLLVTAASGDHVHTEAFQSTRDLSLVLDALLKTKSRMVLVDIMNKNGLQMLHNIIKQNRKKFNKIPILRKLLKVLEFLRLKEILTIEHINMPPPCAGMESFKESIVELTRHNDSQVQEIAKKFREKWIFEPIKQFYSDRDNCRMDLQGGYCNRFSVSHKHWHDRGWHDRGSRHTDAIHCVPIPLDANSTGAMCSLPMQLSSAAPSTDNMLMDGAKKTRKRKSRWDQPAETKSEPRPPQHVEDQTAGTDSNLKMQASPTQQEIHVEMLNQISECQREDGATRQGINDDAPPGFPSPYNNPQVPTNASSAGVCCLCPSHVPQSSSSCEAVVAHPQARYLSHLPVSYGIPLALVQQLGTPQEAGDGWVIAPGIPFHPFPPLPPYPRGQTNLSSAPSSAANRNRLANGAREESQQAGGDHADAVHSCVASDGSLPEVAVNGANDAHTLGRVRWPSDNLGRRFFRQQKWNNNREPRKWPPWMRPRNGWGFKGNNHVRNVSSVVCVGNAANETRDRSSSSGS